MVNGNTPVMEEPIIEEQIAPATEPGAIPGVVPETIEPTAEPTEPVGEPIPIEPEVVVRDVIEPAELIQPEVVEPVAPSEPVIEDVVKPTVEPTPTEKVETAEDLKTKQLDIAAKEQAQVTAEQEKATAEFNQALTAGNFDQLRDLTIANPELRGVFNSQVKLTLGNKANTDYFKKYSGMSNEQMLSEVKNGNIVVGSDQYKLLPPEQRQSFEDFQSQDQAATNTDKEATNNQFNVDNTSTISLDSLVSDMQKLFSTDLRTKYNELLNSDEITNTAKGLEDLQNQVNAKDDELDLIEEEAQSLFKTKTLQDAYITDRQKAILREKNTLTNQYKAKLGTYRTLKDNATTELEFFKYEDAQNKQIYTTALSMYETRRSEMREDEKLAFIEKNKQLAADVQFQRTIALKEFDAALSKEQKGGTYKTDRQGREVYVKDGVSIFVRNQEGEILFTESNEDYTDSTTKENGILITTRSYKDGRPPEYFSYDIEGNSSNNGNTTVNNMISNIKSNDLQCGQAVNKYVVGQLGVSKDDFWMGDSYASKKKYINSNTPLVGGVAIWNDENVGEGKFTEFGHAGIVTGYNATNGTVDITDWNWNGDKKKTTHTVKISDIQGSDGGFYNPDTIPKAVGFDAEDIPLYKKFLEGKLTSSDQKGIKDLGTFKVKSELYQESLTKEGTPQIEKLIQLAVDLRDNSPGRKSRILSETSAGLFLSGDLADYRSKFDAFISNSALENLINLKSNGATFGALSDNELQFIQNAATSLKSNLSDTAYTAELNRIIKKLKKGIPEERFNKITGAKIVTPTIKTGVGTTSGYDVYKNRAKTQGYDYKLYQ